MLPFLPPGLLPRDNISGGSEINSLSTCDVLRTVQRLTLNDPVK